MRVCNCVSPYPGCTACGVDSQTQQPTPTGWQCPLCRRINAPSVLQCPCAAPPLAPPPIFCSCACHKAIPRYKFGAGSAYEAPTITRDNKKPCDWCADRHNQPLFKLETK